MIPNRLYMTFGDSGVDQLDRSHSPSSDSSDWHSLLEMKLNGTASANLHGIGTLALWFGSVISFAKSASGCRSRWLRLYMLDFCGEAASRKTNEVP